MGYITDVRDQMRRRKVTEQDVRTIREKVLTNKEAMQKVAKEYGVSYGAIWKIVWRKTYNWVE